MKRKPIRKDFSKRTTNGYNG